MKRFFTIVRRINSILFLLVLLGVGAGAAWWSWQLHHWYARQYPSQEAITADNSADEPAYADLGDADTVTGTGIQMFSLTAEGLGRRGRQTRNILFLSAAEPQGRWLFPDHGNLILEADQIRPWIRSWRGDDASAPSTALYFEFVPADPDSGREPSEFDMHSVALSRPDGTGLVEVLQDVEAVLSYEQVDATSLTVVYRDFQDLRRARISLDNFAVISDQTVATVPDTL